MEGHLGTLEELELRFPSDQACREYLFALRWPDGFRCQRCQGRKAWPTKRGMWICTGCRRQASATAGTAFQDSRLPLKLWFRAMWYLTRQESGTSALELQRTLELGSYETAWVLLQKLRRAMVRPGRDPLSGTVEVDEAYLGGEKPLARGSGTEVRALVFIAVRLEGKHIDRIRLALVPDASARSLLPAVTRSVQRGSTVRTDGWSGYSSLERIGYDHQIARPATETGANLLPNCHEIASLLGRWLLTTHQGAVSRDHLSYYLDEFTFRFNHRATASSGELFHTLVQQVVQATPHTYRQLVRPRPGRPG